LLIRCTPWCIASVDGKSSGPGERQHQISVAAGKHRVVVQRLEDRKDRSVEIAAGQTATLDFDFP
jgi:hypothetical protein